MSARNTTVNNRPGAGVILVEMYNRRVGQQKKGPAVILFQSQGKYTDAGGYCDGQPFLDTAIRELKEESVGLFRINLNRLRPNDQYFAVKQVKEDYWTFVTFVKGPQRGIRRDKYNANLKVLQEYADKNPTDWRNWGAWNETNGMTRFFIEDIIINGVMTMRGDLRNVPDVYGERHTIAGRAKATIREFLLQAAVPDPASPSWVQLQTQDGKDDQPNCNRGMGPWNTQMYNSTKFAHCYYF